MKKKNLGFNKKFYGLIICKTYRMMKIINRHTSIKERLASSSRQSPMDPINDEFIKEGLKKEKNIKNP